jgi:5-methylcytosine-specific restriction endonuclease McrA
MNLTQQLKDHELNNKLKSLASEEQKLTQTIIEHIAEVDRRKLFLSMAYSSLFDYLTKEINYSAGAAQRRIDAARMLQKIPEVAQKIESGHLNLGQISKVQQICRQIKKESGQIVPTEIQKNVLDKIENLNSQQTDLLLAQEFKIEIKTRAKTHIQRDESTRVELTFSKNEMALIKSAQALLSHKTGGGLKETLIQLAHDILQKSTPKNIKKNSIIEDQGKIQNFISTQTSTYIATHAATDTATVAVKNVTARLRKEILYRDQFCQFINSTTGKVCGSRHYLELDHIVPRFAGGDHDVDNLRVLCKNHNNYRFDKNL